MDTTAPPRRTIREALLERVVAYQNRTKRGRRGSRRFVSSSSYLYSSGGEAGRGLGDLLCDEMEMEQLAAERARNVLVLMSDTGGGHRASAEAIRDAFRIEFGDAYRVFFHDVWKDHAGWPLNDMEGSYKFMIKHSGIWKVAFHGTSPRWVHRGYLYAIAALNAKKLVAGLMKYKPDIIISVHPLMQHVPLAVLRRRGLDKKAIFVTVITDLNTCHPTWFHPRVDRCYCPSGEVFKRALEDGLDKSQIRVFGLPVRPSFCRGLSADLSKGNLREELRMEQGLPAVLLMRGGEGMGPVHKTAKELGDALFDEELKKPIGQLVIVCGRNQVLASALLAMEWKIPVKIRGFEKQMEKWMGACDCIITKAGPGTIAESLIRGLPIILNDYIPGQEVGNVPYVVDNGAGVFCSRPKETAETVARWFTTESDQLRRMSENALKLAQPDAVFHIIRDIHELAQKQGTRFRRTETPVPLNTSFYSSA